MSPLTAASTGIPEKRALPLTPEQEQEALEFMQRSGMRVPENIHERAMALHGTYRYVMEHYGDND